MLDNDARITTLPTYPIGSLRSLVDIKLRRNGWLLNILWIHVVLEREYVSNDFLLSAKLSELYLFNVRYVLKYIINIKIYINNVLCQKWIIWTSLNIDMIGFFRRMMIIYTYWASEGFRDRWVLHKIYFVALKSILSAKSLFCTKAPSKFWFWHNLYNVRTIV